MHKQKSLEKLNAFGQRTMMEHIGIEITDFEKDYICRKMPVDNRTVQPYGLLHGGASAAFAETLGSIAAGMQIDLNDKGVISASVIPSSQMTFYAKYGDIFAIINILLVFFLLAMSFKRKE